MVMMFGEFILNDYLFLKSFKTLNERSFDFEFFQKARVVIKKEIKILISIFN
jgi:hypothetical protein